MPDAIAPSIRAVSNCSNAVNRMFCRSMVSASRRLRKVVIGGSSSLMPLASISFRPVASSNVWSEQALDLAADQQHVELAQRIARVVAFEIVLGAEQALPAGLALALGDGAQRVETPRDRREKALLGLHVGGDGPEQRRLRLVGAVGAAESLDGGVGLPAGLEQIVDAQAPVLRRELGVIAAPGAAGVGEDEDAL